MGSLGEPPAGLSCRLRDIVISILERGDMAEFLAHSGGHKLVDHLNAVARAARQKLATQRESMNAVFGVVTFKTKTDCNRRGAFSLWQTQDIRATQSGLGPEAE